MKHCNSLRKINESEQEEIEVWNKVEVKRTRERHIWNMIKREFCKLAAYCKCTLPNDRIALEAITRP